MISEYGVKEKRWCSTDTNYCFNVRNDFHFLVQNKVKKLKSIFSYEVSFFLQYLFLSWCITIKPIISFFSIKNYKYVGFCLEVVL